MVQVLVTKMPGNVTVLLGDIAKIESSELLCDNFTTWIGLYDKMYKPSTTDVQKYFEHLPEFMGLFPDTAINVIYKEYCLLQVKKVERKFKKLVVSLLTQMF